MKIIKNKAYYYLLALSLVIPSCKAPTETVVNAKMAKNLPQGYANAPATDSTRNESITPWKEFFTDPLLSGLIEEGLRNNQDLMITLQEVEIARNGVKGVKGSLFPSLGYGIGGGLNKNARYTSDGAGDKDSEIIPGKKMPIPTGDYKIGITLEWEADIWNKIRTEKKAAVARYLSTVEGKNFVLSNLIAEIATTYYQLLSLDNQYDIVEEYIGLQEKALKMTKVQKEAAATTELAVKQFEAELAKARAASFIIRQNIVEKENEMNILLGRYPQPIPRDKATFINILPKTVYSGIPSQLLQNRPDIKQAEYELEAAKLDVKAVRKEFYPTLDIAAAFGLEAFRPDYLVKTTKSIAYNATAGLAGPLINKSAIAARFREADAKQVEALYQYEKTVLQAYIDVSNQLSKIGNTDKYYNLKLQESEALEKSIEISTQLFRNSRADYLEVLTVQRDALDARMDLLQAKEDQLNTVVNIYKSLGGGWK